MIEIIYAASLPRPMWRRSSAAHEPREKRWSRFRINRTAYRPNFGFSLRGLGGLGVSAVNNTFKTSPLRRRERRGGAENFKLGRACGVCRIEIVRCFDES